MTTREQEQRINDLCEQHGETRVSMVTLAGYAGHVASVRCDDGYSCIVTEDGVVGKDGGR